MVVNGDIIILDDKEVLTLIDNECRKRLHMSAEEFMRKYGAGELPQSTAVHDIEMLLKLAK